MNTKQITLPFRLKRTERRRNLNVDLIGRSYKKDYATVTVTGVCLNDDQSRDGAARSRRQHLVDARVVDASDLFGKKRKARGLRTRFKPIRTTHQSTGRISRQ